MFRKRKRDKDFETFVRGLQGCVQSPEERPGDRACVKKLVAGDPDAARRFVENACRMPLGPVQIQAIRLVAITYDDEFGDPSLKQLYSERMDAEIQGTEAALAEMAKTLARTRRLRGRRHAQPSAAPRRHRPRLARPRERRQATSEPWAALPAAGTLAGGARAPA